jgi:hypothetical protein
MGKFSEGILGKFTGAIGTVVGSTWRGISYMRIRGARTKTGTPSQAQVEQQVKFKMVTHFLRPLRGLIDVTFKSYGLKMTAANYALSCNLNNAVTGLYPDFKIEYSLILLSQGKLPIADLSTATVSAAGKVKFTWTDDSAIDEEANATDNAVLVAYCEETNLCKYVLKGGSRSEVTGLLSVSGFSGKSVETWILFISADGKKISDSVYTGQVAVV